MEDIIKMEPIAKFTYSPLIVNMCVLTYQDWAILVLIKTFIALCTVAFAQNGIIFQKLITLVADVQKLHILYQNNLLHEW